MKFILKYNGSKVLAGEEVLQLLRDNNVQVIDQTQFPALLLASAAKDSDFSNVSSLLPKDWEVFRQTERKYRVPDTRPKIKPGDTGRIL